MTECIYCWNNTATSRSVEHIFPANLGCTETLPLGDVCDNCNNYFSGMDKVVLLNNYIALHVGTEQIPGRSGNPRISIGERLRFPYQGHVEIKLGPVKISPGMREAALTLQQSKEFDELLFARAVHKIAFNCFAGKYGTEKALHPNFDKIRQYVRKARKNEFWKYAVMPVNPDINLWANFHKSQLGWTITLHLLCLEFFISLGGWQQEFESQLRSFHIVRGPGQWKEGSLLGLKA